jgi:hypothetical protein
VRIRDVGRVDLGAQTYNSYSRLNGQPSIPTFLNLVVVPVFCVVIERLRERFGAEAVAAPAATGPAAPSPGGDGD